MILRSLMFCSLVIYVPRVMKYRHLSTSLGSSDRSVAVCCEPHISNVALIPKSYNGHYLFLTEDNTSDLQILSQ